MRKIILALIFLSLSTISFRGYSQQISSLTKEWTNTYASSTSWFRKAILFDSSLVMSGASWPSWPGGTTDQMITKIGIDGSLKWRKLRAPGSDHDGYGSVYRYPNGNLLFFGQQNAQGTNYFDGFWTRFDANGNELNYGFFNVPGSSSGTDVIRLPNGNFVFSGPDPSSSTWVAISDSNLNQIRYVTFPSGGWFGSRLLCDSQFIYSVTLSNISTFTIAKYDFSLNRISTFVLPNNGAATNNINDAKIIDGNIYLVGSKVTSGISYGVIYKLNSNGVITDSYIDSDQSDYTALTGKNGNILFAKSYINTTGYSTLNKIIEFVGNGQTGIEYTLNNGSPFCVSDLNIDESFIYASGASGPVIIGIPAVEKIRINFSTTPPCQPTSSTTDLTIASTSLPYTWNGLTFNNAGTQTATLTNAAGCDSSATLNLTVTNTIPSYLPSNGLIAWYPFNGNANDESGNGNNGTVNGATLTNDRNGNVGKAYGFDGVNDFISRNNLSISFNYNSSFSITSNVKFLRLDSCRTIAWYGTLAPGNFVWVLDVYNGMVRFGAAKQQYNDWYLATYPSVNLKLNEWYNITGVYDNGSIILYINGVQVSASNFQGSANNNIMPFSIGTTFTQDQVFNYFKGDIDDIAIYNRALTPQEIASLYSGCTSTDSSSFSASACNQYTLPWGDSVTQSGTYVHSYTNNAGCDSVVTAQIIINTASDSTQGETVNGNGTYTLPSGNVATQSGYYTHTYSNQYGCDSVVTFYVVINQSNDSSQSNVGINVNQPQRSLHVRDVIRLEPRNTPPANPTKGDMYFDGTTDKLRIYDGRAWRDAY